MIKETPDLGETAVKLWENYGLRKELIEQARRLYALENDPKVKSVRVSVSTELCFSTVRHKLHATVSYNSPPTSADKLKAYLDYHGINVLGVEESLNGSYRASSLDSEVYFMPAGNFQEVPVIIHPRNLKEIMKLSDFEIQSP